jgi:uncharacterized oxidoreductase
LAHVLPARILTEIGASLFEGAGAPTGEALLTAEHLVTSSLMGVDSHGVLRIPEYLDMVSGGVITPGAAVRLEATSATTAVAHCGRNFGQVGATRAAEAAVRIAREHKVACVQTRDCNHVGRLGAYVQMAASHGFIALATCNSPLLGHFVLPWGGGEGRLATNPMAYAVPTRGDPILMDISTSVVPEGKVRWHRNQGRPLPEGCIVDASGRPTTDPGAFYGPPRGGILPLGGPVGYKGFALSLLVEILGSALAGIPTTDPTAFGNGVCLVVLDPSVFCPLDRFKELIDGLIAYIKSSPPAPGFEEVLVPGEPEFRTLRRRSKEGIPLDDVTWKAVNQHAQRLGVSLKDNVPRRP